MTKPYRVQSVKSIPVNFQTAYGTSSGSDVDYEQLANYCADGDVVSVIAQYQVNGALDSYTANRTAIYGVPQNLGPPLYNQSGHYTTSFEVAEIPA